MWAFLENEANYLKGSWFHHDFERIKYHSHEYLIYLIHIHRKGLHISQCRITGLLSAFCVELSILSLKCMFSFSNELVIKLSASPLSSFLWEERNVGDPFNRITTGFGEIFKWYLYEDPKFSTRILHTSFKNKWYLLYCFQFYSWNILFSVAIKLHCITLVEPLL